MSVGLGFYVIKLIIKFFIKIFSIETHIALLQHSLDFKYEELELRYLWVLNRLIQIDTSWHKNPSLHVTKSEKNIN